MINIFKHRRVTALLLTLALGLLVPAAALAADETAPVATLYSPTVNAAVSDNQKIIFSLNEPVTLASDSSIKITVGESVYTVSASAGERIGNPTEGPWYVSYGVKQFVSGSAQLSLSAGATYRVDAEEGAFLDAANNKNAVLTDYFTTTSGAVTNPVAVIYTITNTNQTVTAGASAVVSGQAVSSGSHLMFTTPADGTYTLVKTVKVDGAATSGVDLSDYTLTGDLEVYYARTDGTLTGTVSISSDTHFGGTLSGTLTNSNQPDTAGITFIWVRQNGTTDTELIRGGSTTTYTLVEADIGKIIRLDVIDSTLSGTLSKTTAAIEKAPYTGDVAIPVVEATTGTSITLQTVSGYEYMREGEAWQGSPSFTGLTEGVSYNFYQRVQETTTTFASGSSEKVAISTLPMLTGTVGFSGAAQSGVALTGAANGSNASGTITYTWQRDGIDIAAGASYTPGADDVGKMLTLVITTDEQSGSISNTTSAVLRAVNSTIPDPPTMASATATSITLNEVAGYQYSLGGVYWQDTTTFRNLVAGAAYSFYQRVAQTDTVFTSAPSAKADFSTLPALTGTVMSSGEARYGITITVSLEGSNNTGALTYTWKRGTVAVGTGTAYAVSAVDVGNQLSVEVTSSVQGGSVTRSFGTVQKAYYIGDPPAAPTRASRTTTKIVLTAVDGCEYSRGGTTWQDSTTFSGLSSGTSYTFYQRYKATATTEASEKSAAYKTSTSTASSSTSDDSSATPTPSGTDSGSTTLYTYTLTQDNTRILYSTMKSLANGNKTQDVTIKQSNVEFTFPKGTMTDTYTQLWYDFGTTINNSIAEQTAKQLAGDAYVATIHFNYSGELPGEANIRFWLGAAHAGKTLYYYLLGDDNSLTFMQTAVVDSTGWVSVTQSHCSDYVFLSSDYATLGVTPTPTASAAVTPTATPTASPEQNSGSMIKDGWFIAAIVLIAVALIVGGIWLYTKNRDEQRDDIDDEF